MNGAALVFLGLVILYIGVTGRGPAVLAALTGSAPAPAPPPAPSSPPRTLEDALVFGR